MNSFVGRAAELRAVVDLLRPHPDGVVRDVVGVHGVGKSMFLTHLTDIARQLPGVDVFGLDMKRHGLGEGFFDDFGANASTAVLWETFTRSRELLGLFADGSAAQFDGFRAACRDQGQQTDNYLAKNEVSLGGRSQVDSVTVTSVVNLSDSAVRQRIREAQSHIDDAFVAGWTAFARGRRILITADAFEIVADDELGHWMVRMAGRLPNTVLVVAHTPLQHSLHSEKVEFQEIVLSYFTPGEVADYLEQRMAPDKPHPGLAELAYEFTDGHPGGVNLIADLIIEKGADLRPEALGRMLSSLSGEPGQQWAELVGLVLEAVQEPVLRRAVDAAAVVSTFDGPLLRELISDDGAQHHDPGEIISQLERLRLLQQVPALSGEPSDRFRLHEFIRLSIGARMRTHYSETWRNLHRAACQFYFRRLADWDDEPHDSYGSWYRFEDTGWQECKREWLQHSGMLAGSRERTVARVRFTLVFFEAFWWWGCYVPFPFNRRLLEDWGRASATWSEALSTQSSQLEQAKSTDVQLIEALGGLLNNYPVSHLKPASAPWDDIRDRLLLIKRLCGLGRGGVFRGTQEEKTELKRTDAFINIFLAHSRRFRDPGDGAADPYYDRALRTFDDLDDRWNVGWLSYEVADLALERGELDRAVTLLVEWLARIREFGRETGEWDYELIGNAHRVLADVRWAAGEPAAAAVEYGHAIANSYWFLGDMCAPDEYTQQFYYEMTTRAAERVVSLRDRQQDAARFLDLVRREVPGTPAGAEPGGDVGSVRENAFPAGPTEQELRAEDSPFMARWSVLCEDRPDPLVGFQGLAG